MGTWERLGLLSNIDTDTRARPAYMLSWESNKPHFTHNSLLEEKDVGCPYYSPLFNNDNFPTNLALNVPHCHLVPALSAAGTFSG